MEKCHWKYLGITLGITFFGMFNFAYLSVSMNIAEPMFRSFLSHTWSKHYGVVLTSDNYAWLSSTLFNAFFIGFTVGSLLLPTFAETIGRVRSISLGSYTAIIGVLTAFSSISFENAILLAWGRIISGIGSGIQISSIVMFIQETSPTNIRGLCSSLLGVSNTAVALLSTVLGLPVVLGSNLHLLIGFSILPELCLIGLMRHCKETPKHLALSKGDPMEARRSIAFYQGENADEGQILLEIMREQEEMDQSEPVNLCIVLGTPHLRKGVLIGTMAVIGQQTSGIAIVWYSSTHIFQNSSLSLVPAQIATFLLLFVMLAFVILSAFLVDRIGRRPILLWSQSLLVLSLLALILAHQLVSYSRFFSLAFVMSTSLYIMFFASGPASIPWYITAELVSQNARSFAMGLSQAVGNTFLILITFANIPLNKAFGTWSFLPLFAIPTALVTLLLYFYLPETQNREVADIVHQFQHKNEAVQKQSTAGIELDSYYAQ